MIPNVRIHVSNEQPLLADLYDLPSASDAGLVCTNVRAVDGKRPIFIDSSAATFFFPYHVIRFLEIPEGSLGSVRTRGGAADPADAARSDGASQTEPGNRYPVIVALPAGEGDDGDLDIELEIDEDFLQRIRDV
ncbi:MAG: hypothetical protein ACYC65_14450 [Candidatus Limnocylindrales bacterium]